MKTARFFDCPDGISDGPPESLSVQNFQSVFEYAAIGMALVARDGRWLRTNRALQEMLGYTEEELQKKTFQEITHPGDLEADLSQVEALLAGRIDTYQMEKRYFHKDGHVVWALLSVSLVRDSLGEELYFISQIQDVTSHVLAMERIAEQAALLDKAQDAIIVRDLEDRIVYWNKGAERIYGWTVGEALGQLSGPLLCRDETVRHIAVEAVMKGGEWTGEVAHRTKDGRDLIVEARGTLVRGADGEPKSILVISTDITEKKKIEAQFLRAQRLESVGTLAGGVAHDLNNILSPIIMSIEILKTYVSDPQALAMLETIEGSATRGADVVRQVLSFARGVEGQRIEVRPASLARDIRRMIEDTFPKNIRLQISVPEDLWYILGDPTQLYQILLNLCVNARDAMPDGGSIIIKAENCVVDEQYAAMNLNANAGSYVAIHVIDTGVGIPQENREKIFEPFFTTKDVGSGTGLGLSTVMAVVKSHGGFINVYSEQGNGTTFKIYLPARTSGPLQEELIAEESPPRGNGELILLVDDELSILRITSQTLQAYGYRTLTASDGAEALALFAQHRENVALVLTDMMMPVMDGSATIAALKRIIPSVKIIAASGLNANGNVLKAIDAGVKHFLSKPYTARTLLTKLREVLDES